MAVEQLVTQLKRGLDAPICLTWELTYACNLACVHCLSSSGKRDPRELIKHLVRMRFPQAESRIVPSGHRIDSLNGDQAHFDTGADEMRNQAGGQRHSAFELFIEFRRRSRFTLDQRVENYGDAPVVVAGEFAHHNLRGLGGRLPVDLASMVAGNVLPDRV